MKLLERALDNVNKWPRDIVERWRQNLIKDVVSVVVTVVIVNTVKPLPLIRDIRMSVIMKCKQVGNFHDEFDCLDASKSRSLALTG